MVLEALRRLVADERLGATATVVAGPDLGAKAVIDYSDGLVAGSMPAEVASDVEADARALMEHEQNRTLTYGERDVYIETVAPPPRLLIFGATHAGQALTTLGKQLGFHVTVSDPREVYTTAERFPDADRLVVGWPDQAQREVDITHQTFVVLLSHDRRFEDPAWPWVLASPAKYIGAMGSRGTTARRAERLQEEGYSEAQISRIHGPVGLDLGGETPEEMAVAIMAEMIKVRYGTGEGETLVGQEVRLQGRRKADF